MKNQTIDSCFKTSSFKRVGLLFVCATASLAGLAQVHAESPEIYYEDTFDRVGALALSRPNESLTLDVWTDNAGLESGVITKGGKLLLNHAADMVSLPFDSKHAEADSLVTFSVDVDSPGNQPPGGRLLMGFTPNIGSFLSLAVVEINTDGDVRYYNFGANDDNFRQGTPITLGKPVKVKITLDYSTNTVNYHMNDVLDYSYTYPDAIPDYKHIFLLALSNDPGQDNAAPFGDRKGTGAALGAVVDSVQLSLSKAP